MTTINIEKFSLKDLVNLESKLQSAIVDARARSRVDVKNKMFELAASHGFSISELFDGGRGKKPARAGKYANPDDKSETYTGRGRRPFWLVARLKKGAKLEDFAI